MEFKQKPLIQIGSTFLLHSDGEWYKLSDISTIPPKKLNNELVLSWEPGLRTRYLDGVCCANCLQFFANQDVGEKLLDGFCEECALPCLWENRAEFK